MQRIQLLDPQVVNQIAAGEVIERPSSVVKELLENSIDAGSTRIEIDLEQGGTESIRIVDDGHGIDADDLPLAFAAHATSKLRTADDLFKIGTLGFRGEALASIGSVAQINLQSRPRHQDLGSELDCQGGELTLVRPWNGAPGTRITVRHLFFNTPVRKKFMRAIATELGHVSETVTRIALSHPGLHLVLRHNGKLVYEVPATATLADRIGLFFGDEIKKNLQPIELGKEGYRITGLIADPKCDRGNAKLQYLFLNGRFIRDRSLGHAFQEAYRGLIMVGRFAIGFLYLQLPPDVVDVNVHPTKAEVRFRDAQAVYHLVRTAVKNRLSLGNQVPMLQVPATPVVPLTPEQKLEIESDNATLFLPPRKEKLEYLPAPWERVNEPVPVPNQQPTMVIQPISVAAPTDQPGELPVPKTTIDSKPPEIPLMPTFRIGGPAIQIHDAYLVVETPEGMLVIDQHALHERILFEQFRRRLLDGKLEVQRLLIPEPIDLPLDQAAAVLDAKEPLAELGLEVEDFGNGTVLLQSYPTLVRRGNPLDIFQGVLDYLMSKERAPSKEHLLHNLIATMACKAAVKAGDPLSPEEIQYLMQLRELAEDSTHCPHGRPTSLNFSKHELEKQFRRIG
jgi:DNA mismatch repair protein MutL